MTTQKQIEANRRNSRRSPGPKTRTGKAASKMNAMNHGLLAEQVAVRGEDPVEFTRVLESLVDELQPQGPLEEQLVERVAACMWRLRRLYRIEAGIFTHESLTIELDRAQEEVDNCKEIRTGFEPLDFTHVHITDEERHGQAMARVEKAVRLLQEESLALGVAFRQDAKNASAISKLSRYEAAIERSFYKALHELQRVQAARQDGQPPASIAVDVTVDGPGSPSSSDD